MRCRFFQILKFLLLLVAVSAHCLLLPCNIKLAEAEIFGWPRGERGPRQRPLILERLPGAEGEGGARGPRGPG